MKRAFPIHAALAAVFLTFLFLVSGPELALGADGLAGGVSGTYRGRVLDGLFRHRQAEARRAASGAALSATPAAAPLPDIGHIAILDDSDGVILQTNFFDLNGSSVVLTPAGSGHTVARGALAYDVEAQDNGLQITLGDDDAQSVPLPFPFVFFGKSYDMVFVHSDGNLTFEEPDAASVSRSLSRAISGPPRVAALFSDLDPSRSGASVAAFGAVDRFVVTWRNVPQFGVFGTNAAQTFQAILFPDGRMSFQYSPVRLNDAVVGIMPGRFLGEATPVDLSAGSATPLAGAIGEIFSPKRELDTVAASAKFYRNHDDAYDFLIFFNALGLLAGPNSFAFEQNIRNDVLGIGDLLNPSPIFDFGSSFGSAVRLQSFVNMGPLSNYPADPTQRISAIGENNTLSVLGQEAGHRFLVYPQFIDPATGAASNALLGRDIAHWSFFFNSNASVVEGNKIEDRGEGVTPRFLTVETVKRYGEFDQYIMGLRRPEEVTASFLIQNPDVALSPGAPPRTGVGINGTRKEITVDMIVAAEGRRSPDTTVSQKEFRFGFALVIPTGGQPSAADLAKVEAIRAAWGPFFNQGVENRGAAVTELAKQLHLSTWPAGGVLVGRPAEAAVTIARAAGSDLPVRLQAGNNSITVPSMVTIPAGSRSAAFSVRGNGAGVAELTADAMQPGYETARTYVSVRGSTAGLSLVVESGNAQTAGLGGMLAEPVVFRLLDENRVPYGNVPVAALANGNGAALPANTTTDSGGRASFGWRLASTGTLNSLTATVQGTQVRATATAQSIGPQPAFSAAGVVNAASFNTGLSAPNIGISAGSLLSIFGTGLSTAGGAAAGFPLPTRIGTTSVRINGALAPLLFVSPTQINLQAPFELSGSTADLAIGTAAGTTSTATVPVAAAQPGIFFDPASGTGAILNSNGTAVFTNAAKAGDIVAVFCTGLGAVLPMGRTGAAAAADPLSRTVTATEATVDGVGATVHFSGLAPFFTGLYQVNVQLPGNLAAGRHRLAITVSGLSSNEVWFEVGN